MGAVTAAAAPAATVSGALKSAVGYKVLLVQANGTSRKVAIRTSAGSFSITRREARRRLAPARESRRLVLRAGRAQGDRDEGVPFIKGSAGLRLGTLMLMSGYATARRASLGRYQSLAAYTAKAVNGKPVGAGKLGRVRTAKPMGLSGPGADLDRTVS